MPNFVEIEGHQVNINNINYISPISRYSGGRDVFSIHFLSGEPLHICTYDYASALIDKIKKAMKESKIL